MPAFISEEGGRGYSNTRMNDLMDSLWECSIGMVYLYRGDETEAILGSDQVQQEP